VYVSRRHAACWKKMKNKYLLLFYLGDERIILKYVLSKYILSFRNGFILLRMRHVVVTSRHMFKTAGFMIGVKNVSGE
jgi:hypothetical protein